MSDDAATAETLINLSATSPVASPLAVSLPPAGTSSSVGGVGAGRDDDDDGGGTNAAGALVANNYGGGFTPMTSSMQAPGFACLTDTPLQRSQAPPVGGVSSLMGPSPSLGPSRARLMSVGDLGPPGSADRGGSAVGGVMGVGGMTPLTGVPGSSRRSLLPLSMFESSLYSARGSPPVSPALPFSTPGDASRVGLHGPSALSLPPPNTPDVRGAASYHLVPATSGRLNPSSGPAAGSVPPSPMPSFSTSGLIGSVGMMPNQSPFSSGLVEGLASLASLASPATISLHAGVQSPTDFNYGGRSIGKRSMESEDDGPMGPSSSKRTRTVHQDRSLQQQQQQQQHSPRHPQQGGGHRLGDHPFSPHGHHAKDQEAAGLLLDAMRNRNLQDAVTAGGKDGGGRGASLAGVDAGSNGQGVGGGGGGGGDDQALMPPPPAKGAGYLTSSSRAHPSRAAAGQSAPPSRHLASGGGKTGPRGRPSAARDEDGGEEADGDAEGEEGVPNGGENEDDEGDDEGEEGDDDAEADDGARQAGGGGGGAGRGRTVMRRPAVTDMTPEQIAALAGEPSNGSGSSCHQCKSRRHVTSLNFCANMFITRPGKGKRRVCRKKYCGQCLVKFYHERPPERGLDPNTDWTCPACRGLCCCALCRRVRTRAQEPPCPSDIDQYTSIAFSIVYHNRQKSLGAEPKHRLASLWSKWVLIMEPERRASLNLADLADMEVHAAPPKGADAYEEGDDEGDEEGDEDDDDDGEGDDGDAGNMEESDGEAAAKNNNDDSDGGGSGSSEEEGDDDDGGGAPGKQPQRQQQQQRRNDKAVRT